MCLSGMRQYPCLFQLVISKCRPLSSNGTKNNAKELEQRGRIDQMCVMLLEPLRGQCIAEDGRMLWRVAGQCIFGLASLQVVSKGKGSMLLSPPEHFPPTPLAPALPLPSPATDGRLPDESHQKARTCTGPAG